MWRQILAISRTRVQSVAVRQSEASAGSQASRQRRGQAVKQLGSQPASQAASPKCARKRENTLLLLPPCPPLPLLSPSLNPKSVLNRENARKCVPHPVPLSPSSPLLPKIVSGTYNFGILMFHVCCKQIGVCVTRLRKMPQPNPAQPSPAQPSLAQPSPAHRKRVQSTRPP